MVDSILSKISQPPGTIARLKVLSPTIAQSDTGLTNAEAQLADLVDLSDQTKASVTRSRKVNAYLQVLQSVLKLFSGNSRTHRVVQLSKSEVEFVTPPKSGDTLKTDA